VQGSWLGATVDELRAISSSISGISTYDGSNNTPMGTDSAIRVFMLPAGIRRRQGDGRI